MQTVLQATRVSTVATADILCCLYDKRNAISFEDKGLRLFLSNNVKSVFIHYIKNQLSGFAVR